MPILHSLTIRRRGTTRTEKPFAPSTTTTHNIKYLFHRKTDSSTGKTSIDNTMGNAPSDMSTTNGAPKQKAGALARASTSDRDSIRSRAMPGAEPPTPVASPEPVLAATDERSPEPDIVQVKGDTQEVPYILNPVPVEAEGTGVAGDLDLEAVFPPVASFDSMEPDAVQRPQDEAEPTSDATDAGRTPRAELKNEEGLAPLDLDDLPARSHATEASDATAVTLSPRVGTPPMSVWAPGTYVLLNARGGTALDLSGADHKTVIGYPMHGGPNQQWEFIPSGHGYLIRCVRRSPDGHVLYLTAEGVQDNASVLASTYPVTWNIQQTEDGIRISWPNSDLVFDLADYGNSAPGTKIQLMGHKHGEACQLWHYTRCAPAADTTHDKEHTVARAMSPPATTETVTISEERDFVTTTRTTTTTVITTVTEVTRMPKSFLHAQQQRQAQRRSITYR